MIVATFAAALGVGRSLEVGALVAFLVSAAAISGVIILVSRENLPGIFGTIAWTLSGALAGSTCGWSILISAIRPWREPEGVAGPIFGAICGAVMGWLVGEMMRSLWHAAKGAHESEAHGG